MRFEGQRHVEPQRSINNYSSNPVAHISLTITRSQRTVPFWNVVGGSTPCKATASETAVCSFNHYVRAAKDGTSRLSCLEHRWRLHQLYGHTLMALSPKLISGSPITSCLITLITPLLLLRWLTYHPPDLSRIRQLSASRACGPYPNICRMRDMPRNTHLLLMLQTYSIVREA